MITMLLSYLGSAAGGAVLKGVFGLIQEWLSGNREREQALIDAAAKREEYHGNRFQKADNYTKHTRRVLAWGMCFTYAAILVLWAIFPQVEVATFVDFQSGGSEQAVRGLQLFGYSLMGVETPTNLANRVIHVTTGHLVMANTYVLAFILGAYFMPTGRR
jgi:hypothetical protein